jgi:hypothetical protein
MTLAAITDAEEADTGRTDPDWYRWLSPTGRWYAARMAPLPDPTTGSMIVSADTLGDLMTAVVHSSPDAVRA